MPSVKVRENEPFEFALRRFKRTCEKAGVLAETRKREFYEKPTQERKRKAAMKAGDKERLGVIRLVNAAIKQKEVDERIELDDAQVLAVLDKMVKQRRDSVSQYDAAGREDLAGIERAEIAVIEHYLPAKLSEAEIVDIVDGAIRD